MTLQIGSVPITSPVLLAPLAGITDLPFRKLVSAFGAGLVVSEMVASQEMVQSKPGVREKAELGFGVENTSVQIAGREAEWMKRAARIVEDNGARIIDINMGCPAKKVTNGLSGSALLKDLDHALSLIEAVVSEVSIPVTLKTRLGWDDASLNAKGLAIRAEQSGVRMLTIHGRTRCQFYKGQADWKAIRPIKNAVGIPVIVNGDIVDTVSARTALAQSGADGVMVGRGIQGRPWQISKIAHELYGTPAPIIPVGSDFVDMVIAHYRDMLNFYGETLGSRVARKHLGWYMDTAGTTAGMRKRILTEPNCREVIQLLPDALSSSEREAAA
ncbi:MAG: tRNA dihydrouridine synthase DusB [Paracoccaceae bacterium]|jgi:nifR3 family TIM-barrel protein|nr:tRNA dihydrouridine synthase DusB [Paracoccaceae bacterium]MDP7184385.1 tRNA dihydrouridine synthase DusB [Paracoccaceae bacterium]